MCVAVQYQVHAQLVGKLICSRYSCFEHAVLKFCFNLSPSKSGFED